MSNEAKPTPVNLSVAAVDEAIARWKAFGQAVANLRHEISINVPDVTFNGNSSGNWGRIRRLPDGAVAHDRKDFGTKLLAAAQPIVDDEPRPDRFTAYDVDDVLERLARVVILSVDLADAVLKLEAKVSEKVKHLEARRARMFEYLLSVPVPESVAGAGEEAPE